MREEEIEQARCRSHRALFQKTYDAGQSSPEVVQAKRICRSCPVWLACLRSALEREEPAGVWGGTTPRDRRALLRQRAARTLSTEAPTDARRVS